MTRFEGRNSKTVALTVTKQRVSFAFVFPRRYTRDEAHGFLGGVSFRSGIESGCNA